MKNYKSLISLTLIFSILIPEILFLKNANAFDVKPVKLFKDGNICIIAASSSGEQSFNLTSLQSSTESVHTKISSSGSLCPVPVFFTGGAILGTTSGKIFQAQPAVQALGRGILITENAGVDGAISSSGDPTGFTSLVSRLGGLSKNIFEISLPSGCDVVDDDDDAVGASSDLTTVNDFSLTTCTSTNGLTVNCSEVNANNPLLAATNFLASASGSTTAKIRFGISDTVTFADGNMIDSILIKLDAQDIFCSSSAASPLTATIIAKNAVDSPTTTETIGTVDLGIPIKAAILEYDTDIATSLKGETSTNAVSNTPVLSTSSGAVANSIAISETDNESIPIGGQSSPILINPSSIFSSEINNINLWLIPSVSNLFLSAPSTSDISFSDTSLAVNSAPYIVMSNTDDLNASFGTLIIPLKKGTSGNPAQFKTKITVKNVGLNTNSSTDSIVSLAFFESVSSALVNTPAGCSINNSTNLTNPVNLSAYCPGSTRALAQNTVVGGAVNESTGANQITTDADITALASRNTTLGTPQILGFTKIISSVTPVDISKVTATDDSNSVITIIGSAGAAISGAMVKIDLLEKNATTAFDSVTIITSSDGIFNSKLKADFSKGDVTLNFKQTVNGIDSTVSSKTISKNTSSSSSSSGSLSCDKTVCGCTDTNCTPSINQVLNYITSNGGLSSVISVGGAVFNEVISSLKKALGLT